MIFYKEFKSSFFLFFLRGVGGGERGGEGGIRLQ